MAEKQEPRLIAKKIFDKQKEVLASADIADRELLKLTTFMSTYASLEIMKLMLSGNTSLVNKTIDELEILMRAGLPKVAVTVRSATELKIEDRRKLMEVLQKVIAKEVVLSVEIDKGLLGGMVIEYEGRVIDLSLSWELEKLKRHLLTSIENEK